MEREPSLTEVEHKLDQLIAAVLTVAVMSSNRSETDVIKRYQAMRQAILQNGGL